MIWCDEKHNFSANAFGRCRMLIIMNSEGQGKDYVLKEFAISISRVWRKELRKLWH